MPRPSGSSATAVASRNDRPIIPEYGVNAQGSGDMYGKGGQMLHTIRTIVGDDDKWRGILHGLQETFGRQTVMGKQVEAYISQQAGIDLTKVFDEYLRTTLIPTFEYRIVGDQLSYRWADVVPGFNMPFKVTLDWPAFSVIHPTEAWQTTRPCDWRIRRTSRWTGISTSTRRMSGRIGRCRRPRLVAKAAARLMSLKRRLHGNRMSL